MADLPALAALKKIEILTAPAPITARILPKRQPIPYPCCAQTSLRPIPDVIVFLGSTATILAKHASVLRPSPGGDPCGSLGLSISCDSFGARGECIEP